MKLIPKKTLSAYCCILALALFGNNTLCAASTPVIEFHVFPLFQIDLRKAWAKTYQDHLLKDAGVPTQFRTAASVEKLIENSTSPAPKIILAHSYLARYLIEENKYTPLTQHTYKTSWILIGLANSVISNSNNKPCIAIPGRLSQLTLRTQKIFPENNYQYLDKSTQDSVVLAVIKGECEFGAVSDRFFQRVKTSKEKPLKTVYQGGNIQGTLIFSASPNISQEDTERIKQSLMKIGHDKHQYFFRASAITPPATAVDNNYGNDKLYLEFKKQLQQTLSNTL